MNLQFIRRAFRRTSLALCLGLMGAGAAQAGAVSVDFDPAFGNSLPNLNWGGSFSFFVADSCITNAQNAVWSSVCGPTTGSGTLTLTDTNTHQSVTAMFNLNVKSIFVQDDAVVAWRTNQTDWLTDFRSLPAAKGNDFKFGYASFLPQLFATKPKDCKTRNGVVRCEHEDDDDHWLKAGYTGLDGVIESEVGGQTVRYGLSFANGPILTPLAETVPEPGSLALFAVAMVAAGVARRRRA